MPCSSNEWALPVHFSPEMPEMSMRCTNVQHNKAMSRPQCSMLSMLYNKQCATTTKFQPTQLNRHLWLNLWSIPCMKRGFCSPWSSREVSSISAPLPCALFFIKRASAYPATYMVFSAHCSQKLQKFRNKTKTKQKTQMSQ